MRHRAFLAFDITDKMRAELSSVVGLLMPKAKGVRWVRPDLMHCTLHFFGDVEEGLLLSKLPDVVAREVRHQAPIHLIGQGIGVFPNWRYPRVIWAGLVGDVEAMISLHARLEESFTEFGFRHDQRSLRLHLTLGRSKSPLKGCAPFIQMIEKMSDRNFGEANVSSLTLYSSVLTQNGPIYTAMRRFPFGGR